MENLSLFLNGVLLRYEDKLQLPLRQYFQRHKYTTTTQQSQYPIFNFERTSLCIFSLLNMAQNVQWMATLQLLFANKKTPKFYTLTLVFYLHFKQFC